MEYFQFKEGSYAHYIESKDNWMKGREGTGLAVLAVYNKWTVCSWHLI